MKKKILSLDEISVNEKDGRTLLEVKVEGRYLFYNLPGEISPIQQAEAIVCALLLPAMQKGLEIQLPDELCVSERFLKNISIIQAVFIQWFHGLQTIALRVNTCDEVSRQNKEKTLGKVAAFYSGGIDANYTMLKHQQEITDLIYVRGIDMQLNDDSLWHECIQRNNEVAEKYGLQLNTVETNVRFFIRESTEPLIGWNSAVGCGLASIAHLMGYQKNYIASSNTYQHLHALGTHPLTDRFFSSEHVELIHDGNEASRYQKLQLIALDPFLLSRLRVCWQDKGFNCGKCDKCLHLRIALTLLGLHTDTLAPLNDFSELKNVHTGSLGDYVEWQNNLELAQKVDNQQAIKALKTILRRYEVKQLCIQVDEVLFTGRLKKITRGKRN